jgi:excisionase family DNA binding protein
VSKDKLLPISIFSLAISIIIAASMISKGLQTNGIFISEGISRGFNNISSTFNNNTMDNKINNIEERSNLNFREAAEYLRISETTLINIVLNKESKIPHMKIDKDYIFNKEALDKWVQESGFEM